AGGRGRGAVGGVIGGRDARSTLIRRGQSHRGGTVVGGRLAGDAITGNGGGRWCYIRAADHIADGFYGRALWRPSGLAGVGQPVEKCVEDVKLRWRPGARAGAVLSWVIGLGAEFVEDERHTATAVLRGSGQGVLQDGRRVWVRASAVVE